MGRLPEPGKDAGTWGGILNDYLLTEHDTNGVLKLRTDGTLDAFYKKPAAGIPLTDLDAASQTKMAQAASAYQKPGGGIPKADLAASLQTLLDNTVSSSSLSINVKSFGATGDGTTDDTTALSNALQAANTAGGATVLIPRGVYIVSADLSIPANTTVMGEGKNT